MTMCSDFVDHPVRISISPILWFVLGKHICLVCIFKDIKSFIIRDRVNMIRVLYITAMTVTQPDLKSSVRSHTLKQRQFISNSVRCIILHLDESQRGLLLSPALALVYYGLHGWIMHRETGKGVHRHWERIFIAALQQQTVAGRGSNLFWSQFVSITETCCGHREKRCVHNCNK